MTNEPDYRALWLREQAETAALRQRLDGIRQAIECPYPYDEAAYIYRLKVEITIHGGVNRNREIVSEMARQHVRLGAL